jgi:hypothetical protein
MFVWEPVLEVAMRLWNRRACGLSLAANDALREGWCCR